jgi:hypothetical protein
MAIDKDLVRDIVLFIENDGQLYRQYWKKIVDGIETDLQQRADRKIDHSRVKREIQRILLSSFLKYKREIDPTLKTLDGPNSKAIIDELASSFEELARDNTKIRESKDSSETETLEENFQPAAPAVVSGDLNAIGKRAPAHIPPKFAMLLKDIDENGDSELRLLVTYPNGESLILPPAGEPGAVNGNDLLSHVLGCLGTEDSTVRVISAALNRSRHLLSESIQEESITDQYQQMVNALNVLKTPAGQKPNSPANMTKLEALGVLLNLGAPIEKAQHALLQAGHTMEDIDDLLALAQQGIK